MFRLRGRNGSESHFHHIFMKLFQNSKNAVSIVQKLRREGDHFYANHISITFLWQCSKTVEILCSFGIFCVNITFPSHFYNIATRLWNILPFASMLRVNWGEGFFFAWITFPSHFYDNVTKIVPFSGRGLELILTLGVSLARSSECCYILVRVLALVTHKPISHHISKVFCLPDNIIISVRTSSLSILPPTVIIIL